MVVPTAEEIDWIEEVTAFALETPDGEVLVSGRREGRAPMVTGEVRARLEAVRTAGPVRLQVRTDPPATVLAPVAEVPGFGWRAWRAGQAPARQPGHAPGR